MTRVLLALMITLFGVAAASTLKYEEDAIPTPQGELRITFLGHASLIMTFGGKVIQVDPFGQVADYGQLPKADLVLVTHDHYDHLDPKALQAILKPGTVIVAARACAGKIKGAVIIGNGESTTALGLDDRGRRGLQHRSTSGRTGRRSIPRAPGTATSSPSAASGSISPATRRTRRR